MRKLQLQQGWRQKLCCWLSEKMDYWWIKYFMLPLLQTLPPGCIVFAIDHEEQAKAAIDAGSPAFDGILKHIAAHPFLAFLAAALYLVLLNGIINIIREKSQDSDEIDSKGLLTLFEALEAIVGAKADRFGQFIKKLNNSTKKPLEIFNSITKPDQQVALIATGLHGFLDAIDTVNVNFKVCIISVDDGLPAEFYYYHPISDPPKARIEDLRSDESTVSTCIKKKDIIIIPDVHLEAKKDTERRYVGSLSGQDERSLICYPVIHHYTKSIPYVISVVADKKGYFQTEKKQFYKWIFKHFAVRMALEHSLLVLKKETEDHEKK